MSSPNEAQPERAGLLDEDREKIKNAVPPKLLTMNFEQLHTFLQTKNPENSLDATLYPEIEAWMQMAQTRTSTSKSETFDSMKQVLDKVKVFLQNSTSLNPRFKTDTFLSNLVLFSMTSAIFDFCYDGDYGFEFDPEIQPYSAFHENADGTAWESFPSRQKWGEKPIKDWLFSCKLTKTTCEHYNSLSEVHDVLKPFMFKKVDKCMLKGKFRHTPTEGCFCYGMLRNLCGLVGFEFDANQGRCMYTAQSCAEAGMTYSAEKDRCWSQNLDYIFGVLFSDAALMGAKSAEYKMKKSCMCTVNNNAFCNSAVIRATALAMGIVAGGFEGIRSIRQASLDPVGTGKGIAKAWENYGDNFKGEYIDGRSTDDAILGILEGSVHPKESIKRLGLAVQTGSGAVAIAAGGTQFTGLQAEKDPVVDQKIKESEDGIWYEVKKLFLRDLADLF